MSDCKTNQLTGAILAGGRATRMGGQDKGLIILNKRPLIEYLIDTLGRQTDDLLINANRNIGEYRTYGLPVVSDASADFSGPLAGMLAAISYTDKPYILTVPCDSPLLANDYAQRMQRALAQKQARICVAHDGNRLQPVFALISTSLRNSLHAYLDRGERKIDRWFAQEEMVTADFSDHTAMFRNINTPQELATLATELSDRCSERT